MKNNPDAQALTCRENRRIPQLNKAWVSLIVVSIFLFLSYSNLGFSSENAKDEKTKCIAQLSLMERMAITHWNLYTLNPGEPLLPAVLVENGYIKGLPACPSGGRYSYTNKVPSGKKGSNPYASCDHKGHTYTPYQANNSQKNRTALGSRLTESDKTRCVAQLSQMEKWAIIHSNLDAIEPGARLPATSLVKEAYIKKLPTCPSGGSYSYTNNAPSGGKGTKPYASCDHKGHTYDPYQPKNPQR